MGAGKAGRVKTFERCVSPQVSPDSVTFPAEFAFELPPT